MKEKPLFDKSPSIVRLDREIHYADNGIVSRTLFNSAYTRVVLFGFDDGQELSEHSTPRHALIQMLAGKAEWMLNGKKRILHAGEMLYLPPHYPHAVRAKGRFSMMITLGRAKENRVIAVKK